MGLIKIMLELFGVGWFLLIILVAILGGRFMVQLKNPFTKKMESITDITIDRQK